MSIGKTKYVILDRYAQQIQGIGSSEQEAFDEAKSYRCENLPESLEELQENISGDPRYTIKQVSNWLAKVLDDTPEAFFGHIDNNDDPTFEEKIRFTKTGQWS